MSRFVQRLKAMDRASAAMLLYLLAQPLLDALTGLCVRGEWPVTIGTVVRVAFLAVAFGYVLVQKDYRGSHGIRLAALAAGAYLAVLFLWSLFAGGLPLLVRNAGETLKVFTFYYTVLLLLVLYRKHGFLLPLWSLAVVCAGYCGIILLAYLTGTSFVSYNAGYGYCGWFYSANDVSNLILLTAPVLLLYGFSSLVEGCTMGWGARIALAAAVGSTLFSAAFLGTKLVYLGVAVYLAASFLWFLVRRIQTHRRALTRGAVAAALLLTLLAGLYPISPLNDYLEDIYMPMSGEDPEAMAQSQAIPGLVEVDRAKKHAEREKAAEGTWLGEKLKSEPLLGKLDWILSRRLLCIAPILQEYLDGGIRVKLLGLGYGQTAAYEKDIGQLVEMEPLMLLLRHGVVGVLLYGLPVLAVVVYLIVQFFRRLGRRMSSLPYCTVLYSAMAALAASLVVGHILQAPNVGMMAAAVYGQLFSLTEKTSRPREEWEAGEGALL